MENVTIPRKSALKSLLNPVRYLKARPATLWDSLDIPAKLFHKISETNNIHLLTTKGNPTKKQLNNAWFSIIDQVWRVRKDDRQRNIQTKRVHISLLTHKISVIRMILRVLYDLILTKKQRDGLIQNLKNLNIVIKNVPDHKFKDEIHRVLTRDLAGLRTKLNIEQDRLKDMSRPISKKIAYERICAKLSRMLSLRLDLNMTLGEYLAYEQEAIEISNDLNKSK